MERRLASSALGAAAGGDEAADGGGERVFVWRLVGEEGREVVFHLYTLLAVPQCADDPCGDDGEIAHYHGGRTLMEGKKRQAQSFGVKKIDEAPPSST